MLDVGEGGRAIDRVDIRRKGEKRKRKKGNRGGGGRLKRRKTPKERGDGKMNENIPFTDSHNSCWHKILH